MHTHVKQFIWDETKRESNLEKHGLNFADALFRCERYTKMKQTFSTKNTASDDAPKLRKEDLARATLKVGGKAVSRQEFTAATKHTLAKQRVSIMLDGAVLAYFKNKAGDRGYQTLINEALRQSMHSEEMEATLRRVIREELRNS